MRRSRGIAALAVLALVASCGGDDDGTGTGTGDASRDKASSESSGRAVDLGDQAEVEPVERFVGGARSRDAQLLRAAFAAGDCETRSLLGALMDDIPEGWIEMGDFALVSVAREGDDAATVSFTAPDGAMHDVSVVEVDGEWYIALDLCAVVRAESDRIAAESDRIAMENLRYALSAAKVYFTDAESYAGLTAEDLASIEPSLDYGGLDAARPGVVGFVADDQEIVLVTQSSDGEWFCLADSLAGITYGRADELAAVDSVEKCDAESW